MPDAAAFVGRKRRRDEGPGTPQASPPDELSLDSSLSLSDTMIALRVMHAQFPKIEKVGIQPFVLKTQLYSSVKDRTLVDRQLELLKKERSICIFKLNTGQDDHAVMLMDDYLRLVERSMEKVEVKDKNDLAVFDWFRTYVIGTKLDTGIGHHDLYTLLSSGGKVKEEHVSLLIKAGLLTRQLIDPNSYWFAIPSIGSILKGLSQGRKELLSFLNRRKYKEMLMAPLEKQRLRLSLLDMRFHLRDLIGSGHLKTLETPMGVLVQVSKD